MNVHPCFVTSSAELRTGTSKQATGHLEARSGISKQTAVQPAEPPLAITSAAAAAANVPRSAPYPPARWQVAAAAVLLLRPCRSATGGNSRSTVHAHQQPVQRPAMSPPASRACAALLQLHCCAVLIASLPQPSQSPCGVCSVPCARCCVTDSAAASLFVYNLPLLIGSAGAAQKGDKRVRHFGGVFTLPYRMQCPLCCVAARARSMSD